MFRVQVGKTQAYCDGVSRRSFVQLGVAGMASVGLPTIWKSQRASAELGSRQSSKKVILIWLDGGPSHMDLYDLKPEAPAEYRGIWMPIKSNVPGMEMSPLFPLQATIADKFSILRSLHHGTGDHFAGGHVMLTSRYGASGADTAGRYPGIGSIVNKVCGPRTPGMPGYVAIPYGMSIGIRPGYFGANYLGLEHNPFETEGDPNAEGFTVPNLLPSGGMTLGRLEDRRSLLCDLDQMRRAVDHSGAMNSVDKFQTDAYQLVAGTQAAKAFDISAEDNRIRDLYGRHSWGQSTLLARRLVEAGSTFVTVHFGGWDHHWDLKAGMENYLPKVDQAVYGLFSDLEMRGLLSDVLVLLCGEFSRTPRMNDGGNGGAPMSMGTPGRDHWGNSMFCLVGGGGAQGGRLVGSTSRLGDVPKDRPVTPADLHATIYNVLGVDPTVSFLNHAGRPVPAIDHGEVIHELF